MGTDLLSLTLGQWMQQKRGNRKAGALAEEAGITPQMWSDLENDRSRRKDGTPTRPTIETCRKIATVLGEPLDAVLRLAGYPVEGAEDAVAATDESLDLPAYEAFLLGLPRQMQKAEYERIRQLWLEHRRSETDFGKKADDER